MFRYKLRTLLIVLALGPPVLAMGHWGWGEYREWRERLAIKGVVVSPDSGLQLKQFRTGPPRRP